MRWKAKKIVAEFGNLGGASACQPSEGLVNTMTVRSPGLRTQNGLRVGQRSSRIAELHPSAVLHNDGWWLYEAFSPIGDGGYYPLLKAIVSNGRVSALKATIGAAGE